MRQLWTEQYRPKTIKEYVFKDAHQKEQITSWIAEQSIPHLLFTGAPGTGKCLDGDELIDTKIADINVIIPIRELFKNLGIDDIEYNVPVKNHTEIKILSPAGYVPINAFIKKRHAIIRVYLENGESITCSTNHVVFEYGVPKLISQCQSIDTITGPVLIHHVTPIGFGDVYDVSLDAPHQYVTPNGVIHHNTSLAKILLNELAVNEFDILEINASRTNSIDDVRNKIVNFVQMIPFGDFKAVLLDECLDKHTKVVVKRETEQLIEIKDLDDQRDLVKTYNVNLNQIEWKPFRLVDKGRQWVVAIEFKNNTQVICTLDHKWYAGTPGSVSVVKTCDLGDYSGILTACTKKNKLEFLPIKEIKKLNYTSQVYDLSVEDNHNFFITDQEILTHNCDFLSVNAQAALRGLLEEHHSTARFIFTANYFNKVIPAIHSRCQGFHIETLDLVEFTTKAAEILISEKIDFELDTLDTFVKSTYPDLRKCINSLQENSFNGKLSIPELRNNQSADYKIKMVELFKNGQIREARELLCSQARADEMEDIYRWLYSNLQYLGKTEQQREDAILIIKNGLVDHTICSDPEINLASVLIKLARNAA